MTKYVTLAYNKKLNLLRAHSMGCDWPDLDQKHWCFHCDKQFDGHSVRVWQSSDGALWLECGTPGCDGSPIDWAPFPWWNPDNAETRRKLRSRTRRKKTRRGGKASGQSDSKS